MKVQNQFVLKNLVTLEVKKLKFLKIVSNVLQIGLWQYDANPRDGACVYKSTIINTSKEMMAFSDFPVPEDFPNFMHNTKVIEYFHLYANK